MAGIPRGVNRVRNITVVDPRSLFAAGYIVTERWNRMNLKLNVTVDYRTTVLWLVRRRLLHNNLDCGICGRACSLLSTGVYSDRYIWYCRNCRFQRTVREGSVFQGQHEALQTQLLIMYEWANETPACVCEREMSLSHKTTVTYYTNFRRVCSNYLLMHPVMIGGVELINGNVEAKIVEIDESLFSRRKYNRGHHRIRRGQWVLGGIERGSRRCFLEAVAQRDEATLRPIIQAHVDVGSIIVTDMWRSYNTLNQLPQGYDHRTVNHSVHFVDPNDRGVHTNNVENMWHRVKGKQARMSG